LDGFSKLKDELDKLSVKVVAASVDDLENAKTIADQNNFPIGYGVTKDLADQLGAFWEDRRQIIQPTQFIINAEGKVMTSAYADGPLGRIDAEDVVKMVNFYESMKK